MVLVDSTMNAYSIFIQRFMAYEDVAALRADIKCHAAERIRGLNQDLPDQFAFTGTRFMFW